MVSRSRVPGVVAMFAAMRDIAFQIQSLASELRAAGAASRRGRRIRLRAGGRASQSGVLRIFAGPLRQAHIFDRRCHLGGIRSFLHSGGLGIMSVVHHR
jgi:hypothetical protein